MVLLTGPYVLKVDATAVADGWRAQWQIKRRGPHARELSRGQLQESFPTEQAATRRAISLALGALDACEAAARVCGDIEVASERLVH